MKATFVKLAVVFSLIHIPPSLAQEQEDHLTAVWPLGKRTRETVYHINMPASCHDDMWSAAWTWNQEISMPIDPGYGFLVSINPNTTNISDAQNTNYSTTTVEALPMSLNPASAMETRHRSNGDEMVEADIRVNPDYLWFGAVEETPPNKLMCGGNGLNNNNPDFIYYMAHEIGHVIGFADATLDEDCLMKNSFFAYGTSIDKPCSHEIQLLQQKYYKGLH